MSLENSDALKIAYPDIKESTELYSALESLLREGEHFPVICGKSDELSFYKDLISQGLEVIEVPDDQDNVVYAAQELKKGNIHAVLAGNISSTGDVIGVGIHEIGMQEGIKRASSYFLMEHPNYGEYIFADSGCQPNPTAEFLIEIITLTCENAVKHGMTPKVALLDGGVTNNKISEVSEYFEKNPISGVEICPNMSFEDAIADNCNTFIFPDLNSGNILYKAAERMSDMSVSDSGENEKTNYGFTELTNKEGDKTLFPYNISSSQPNEEELFQTALTSIIHAKKIGMQPQVAFLTFSTAGSGKEFSTILPARAAAKRLAAYIQEHNIEDVVVIDQEVQLDAALLPEKAQKKGIKIDNPSNICIAADIYTAKMVGSVVQNLGGSSANGPRLQGFKLPIHDFSRGASDEDIERSHKTTEVELSNK